MFKLGESVICHAQMFSMLKSSICMGAIRNHFLTKKKGKFLLTWVHVEGRERHRILAGGKRRKTILQCFSVGVLLLCCTASGGKRSCLFRRAGTQRCCALPVSLNQARGLCSTHQSSDSRTRLNMVMFMLQRNAKV